jgi:hypothetical protein
MRWHIGEFIGGPAMIAGRAPGDEGAWETVLDQADGLPALGQARLVVFGVFTMRRSIAGRLTRLKLNVG